MELDTATGASDRDRPFLNRFEFARRRIVFLQATAKSLERLGNTAILVWLWMTVSSLVLSLWDLPFYWTALVSANVAVSSFLMGVYIVRLFVYEYLNTAVANFSVLCDDARKLMERRPLTLTSEEVDDLFQSVQSAKKANSGILRHFGVRPKYGFGFWTGAGLVSAVLWIAILALQQVPHGE